MAGKESKVVVIVNERVLVNQKTGQYAVRYDGMRLTAYGKTYYEAASSLKRLFNDEINYFRDKGILKDRLEKLGVEWFWASEYKDDGLPYQDTSAQKDEPRWVTPVPREQTEQQLAMAA